eukprot:CAMPEP_0197638508 /NCGR_PEP_ID=MMETSP1338-20131121/13415_1 /TAXON_ID=43686 ORGANISM="Pelagodinium beii, Strain RCC1491" /NCGR_SAMPLE_ID=MMETSP1338 /ASSEMBLY_ACC=CAM_ASM_000754 /LENGTH=386 /DNA_ID=CAMNT_0043211097 /DNA_START=188 /DNA_END=1348 /DNA_ORIENTATION=-
MPRMQSGPSEIRVLCVDLNSQQLHNDHACLEGLTGQRVLELRIKCSRGVLTYCRESSLMILRKVLACCRTSLRHIHLRFLPNPAWLMVRLCREGELTLSGNIDSSDSDRYLADISNAMLLADLNLKLTRDLSREVAFLELLTVFQEILHPQTLTPHLSGISIVADMLGCEQNLQQELTKLHVKTLDSHAEDSTRGLALDAYQSVRFLTEEKDKPKSVWHKWSLSFAYLIVCEPVLGLLAPRCHTVAEDRADGVRRLCCDMGHHHDLDPSTAYANTSCREKAFAAKYLRLGLASSTALDKGELQFAGQGPHEFCLDADGVQEELARWTSTAFARGFVEKSRQKPSWQNRHLQIASLAYEDQDVDLDFIRRSRELQNSTSIAVPDAWD